MRFLARIFTISMILASAAYADTVTLRNGRTVVGSFLGGDARSIRVAVGDRVETYSLSDVANLSFDGAPPSNAASEPAPRVFRPEPGYQQDRREDRRDDQRADSDRPRLERRDRGDDLPPPQPNYPPAQSSYPPVQQPPPPPPQQMIASGTVLTIRMVDSVDSERDTVGKTFRASLDEPVMDNGGNTMVPRGSDVIVKLVDDKQSGKIEGRTVLTLDRRFLEHQRARCADRYDQHQSAKRFPRCQERQSDRRSGGARRDHRRGRGRRQRRGHRRGIGCGRGNRGPGDDQGPARAHPFRNAADLHAATAGEFLSPAFSRRC